MGFGRKRFVFSMGNNQFVMLKEPFLPNVSNVADPWNLVINDHKLYVSNSGPRRGTEDQYVQTKISVLDQGNWSVIDMGEVLRISINSREALIPIKQEIEYIRVIIWHSIPMIPTLFI